MIARLNSTFDGTCIITWACHNLYSPFFVSRLKSCVVMVPCKVSGGKLLPDRVEGCGVWRFIWLCRIFQTYRSRQLPITYEPISSLGNEVYECSERDGAVFSQKSQGAELQGKVFALDGDVLGLFGLVPARLGRISRRTTSFRFLFIILWLPSHEPLSSRFCWRRLFLR